MASKGTLLSCSQHDCDFSTHDPAKLATHQQESSDSIRWACPSYVCLARFCTTAALGDEHGTATTGHIHTCDLFKEWNSVSKYGIKMNAKMVGTCLHRAKQIANGKVEAAAAKSAATAESATCSNTAGSSPRDGSAAATPRSKTSNKRKLPVDDSDDDEYVPKKAAHLATPRQNPQKKRPQGTDEGGEASEEPVDVESSEQMKGAAHGQSQMSEHTANENGEQTSSIPPATPARRSPKIWHCKRTQAEAEAMKSSQAAAQTLKHTQAAAEAVKHIQAGAEPLKRYRCSGCKKTFTTFDECERHLEENKECDRYACSGCMKVFLTLNECEHHLKKTNQCPRYVCNICKKEFSTCDECDRHVDEANKYLADCAACDYIGCEEEALRQHLRGCANLQEWMNNNGMPWKRNNADMTEVMVAFQVCAYDTRKFAAINTQKEESDRHAAEQTL